MILFLTGAEILHNGVLLGYRFFFHYGMNFRIFEVMSAYNIGYQLIILQHWVQINYFKTLDTN